jgi:hypothetical protein
MGNTILAHALFACNQIDIDLDNFFSDVGDAHNIAKFNFTNLSAKHLIEYPDRDVQCVLEVICKDWSEVLRLKLSYNKWSKSFPTINNWSNFYSYRSKIDTDLKLWQDFYSAYRDPSWPDCDSFESVINLPLSVQQEINRVYIPSKTKIPSTENEFVEWLTECYYDQFLKPSVKYFENAKSLDLENYINGDYSELIEVCSSVLGWEWDITRSKIFHKQVLYANAVYLDWLKKIKHAVSLLIDNKSSTTIHQFELWEQAIILATACKYSKLSTTELLWDTVDCTVNKNNLYLDVFIRTKNYGKAI